MIHSILSYKYSESLGLINLYCSGNILYFCEFLIVHSFKKGSCIASSCYYGYNEVKSFHEIITLVACLTLQQVNLLNFIHIANYTCYYLNIKSYHSLLIIDRRGRKLQLTSRKHFKLKPKRNQNKSQELELNISLPLSAYIDGPVKAVENLQTRLNNCETVPLGIFGQYSVCCMLVRCLCI